MKKHFRVFSVAFAATAMLWAGTTSAQTLFTPTGTVSNGSGGIGVNANPAFAPLDVVGNNILLRPSNFFNPNGKFIGIGESGGIPGPINGCDIYGFRAQRNLNQSFINMGIRRIGTPGGLQPVVDDYPTISWGGDVPFSSGKIFRKNLDFLYDNSSTSCGFISVRMSSPSLAYQLTVFGDARATGMFIDSDARFKQNIQPIGNALSLISQLQGTTYTMNQEAFPERNFNEGNQYGFIAQDLQKVMPEAVLEDEDGYLAVNYIAVVPLMVEGMKEQQVRLEAAETENIELNEQVKDQQVRLEAAELENEELNNQVQEQQAVLEQQDLLIRQIMQDLEAIKNGTEPASKGNSASTGETSQLFQNRPNPFRESTEIHFYLPTDVEQATLVIYSLDGKELMSFNNLDRGYGNVLVAGNELQPGNYVYRLVADNEVVDSKTLVLSK
ncbi:MAG: tail fiber domain-containing protein [Salibacteraceae bacterium]